MAMDEKMWRKQHFSEKEVENPFGYVPWATKTYILEVFMVNNLVFRWPKPLFFMVLGAHGILYIIINTHYTRTSLHPHFRS